MLDFEIQRCTRRCAKSGRDLAPGETIYSVLTEQGSGVVRLDFAAEAWEGPPDGAVGWWKSTLPAAGAAKANWAPGDVMLEYFERLAGDESHADVRYVLALLMIRRRILRLEETEKEPGGGETLVVFCPRTEAEYRITAVYPDEARVRQIQAELGALLVNPGGGESEQLSQTSQPDDEPSS